MAKVLESHAVIQEVQTILVLFLTSTTHFLGKEIMEAMAFLMVIKEVLALCTNGVNPFAHNRVQYSMWPIMLTLLNLPRNLRNSFASILLGGIVPSNGAQKSRSLDPYLHDLVNELIELSSFTLYDANQDTPFNCKVVLF